MREKLIEILLSSFDEQYYKRGLLTPQHTAADLIANGVTIQKWIPVTERLPEKDVLVLCIGARGGMFLGMSPWLFSDETSAYFSVPNSRRGRYATHWMPLPQPPKGE